MSPSPATELESLVESLAAWGLRLRGAFHPTAEDRVPSLADGRAAATLVLIGGVGGSFWQSFAQSPEFGDGAPHPLDRWSQRVIAAVAEGYGALALFPFATPPLPFLTWARRAEPSLSPSPLGLMIHPRHGLWHSYRGALCFGERLALPEPLIEASPCESCLERPCLSACPVSAFDGTQYDVAGCAAHLSTTDGDTCFAAACQARRACPVGAETRYGPEQARFHMGAFFRARTETVGSDGAS